MCRYVLVNYKQSYACFSCRKCFKKVTLQDYLNQNGLSAAFKVLTKCKKHSERVELEKKLNTSAEEIESTYQAAIKKCPDCGDEMANVGMDFKAPKKSNVKEWKILEGMYEIGAIYQTCGCQAFGYVPSSKSEYKKYLNLRLLEFQGRLDEVLGSSELNAYQREEQSTYWSTLINNVKKVVASVV